MPRVGGRNMTGSHLARVMVEHSRGRSRSVFRSIVRMGWRVALCLAHSDHIIVKRVNCVRVGEEVCESGASRPAAIRRRTIAKDRGYHRMATVHVLLSKENIDKGPPGA